MKILFSILMLSSSLALGTTQKCRFIIEENDKKIRGTFLFEDKGSGSYKITLLRKGHEAEEYGDGYFSELKGEDLVGAIEVCYEREHEFNRKFCSRIKRVSKVFQNAGDPIGIALFQDAKGKVIERYLFADAWETPCLR